MEPVVIGPAAGDCSARDPKCGRSRGTPPCTGTVMSIPSMSMSSRRSFGSTPPSRWTVDSLIPQAPRRLDRCPAGSSGPRSGIGRASLIEHQLRASLVEARRQVPLPKLIRLEHVGRRRQSPNGRSWPFPLSFAGWRVRQTRPGRGSPCPSGARRAGRGYARR